MYMSYNISCNSNADITPKICWTKPIQRILYKQLRTMSVQIARHPRNCVRLLCSVKTCKNTVPSLLYYATTIDPFDIITQELLQRHQSRIKVYAFDINKLKIRHFTETESNYYDVSKMSNEDLDKILLELHAKSKDKYIEQVITDCRNVKRFIVESTLKRLFRHYSNVGKPDMVVVLQKYCAKVDPNLFKRNGEFLHYSAKAQCMKGNSEKGLEILKQCYRKNENFRSLYRIIFRELIQDSVLNKSEATLVIFKKYVLEFSQDWEEHYPLICFWHICWSSSWFSDQMLANELLDSSEILQNIVRDKATAFSITVLRDYNEDAVTRLLQGLLKYKMMIEYAKVLQVLFNYKLRNRDLRGCTEILKNCGDLGVTLPSDQQGKYIKMLISGQQTETKPTVPKPTFKYFKLKF
ncbi:uncharacterized protein LOC128677659 [Plodia interpunctella]|uniref:uncharacterized protein LOC128677659 n=1 Tax=Plodia interpunctella TaxID=58824 RepID=UPI002367A9BC|nr:uncharacterized protein LOC128677659 [Plodia interpunctella]